MSTIAQNAKAIFLEAVEKHAPAEWPAFLDQACGDDRDLRNRIQGLLQAHAEKDSLFDRRDPTVEYQHIEQASQMIGPYKLRERLGTGGMGVVWAAEQKQPLRRKVALKVIKPGMDTSQVIARFEAEREALSLMDHPNIARVLDAGTTDQGRPYFVMELIHGITITDYCDAHKLTISERLELFTLVCKAVQHAHQKGVIHRDIKPQNVLVTEQDGKPVPKVIDFGVAKALHQSLTDRSVYTGVYQAIGTLAYMSPEQAALSASDVDTRADIYGLGALLYELLTGTTPIDRQQLEKAALDVACRVIREQDPPRPSLKISTMGNGLSIVSQRRATEPTKLSKIVRGELDWIVMKALDKERNRRYQTAGAFAEDIRRFVQREAVEACPPSVTYKLKKFVGRHRGFVVTGTALVLILGLATCVSISQKFAADEAKKVAEAALVESDRAKMDTQAALEASEKDRGRAEIAEGEAIEVKEKTRLQWYLADMNHAGYESSTGNYELTTDLLKRHIPTAGQRDLRGLEWYLLWKRCQAGILAETQQIPIDAFDMALSPDKQTLVVGGWSGGVVIDLTQAKDAKPLMIRDRSCAPVAFSPDGQMFAIRDGKNIQLSDASQIRRLERVEPLAILQASHAPQDIAFSPDSKMLVSCTRSNGVLRLWRVLETEGQRDWKELGSMEFSGHSEKGIERVAFTSDGKAVVYEGRNGILGIWRLPESSEFDGQVSSDREEKLSSYAVGVSVATDGRTVAFGTGNRVVVWDLTKNIRLHSFDSSVRVSRVVISPDGRFLASSHVDNSTLLWDLTRGTRHRLWGHSREVRSIAFIQDGATEELTLVTGSQDRMLKYWKIRTDDATSLDQIQGCWSVATAPGSEQVVVGHMNGTVASWRLRGKIRPERHYEHTASVRQVALSALGAIASCTRDEIRLWKPSTGQDVVLAGHSGGVYRLKFSPDGTVLASFHNANEIAVWNVASGELIRRMQAEDVSWLESSEFLSNPERLITDSGVGNNDLCVWNYRGPGAAASVQPRIPVHDFVLGGSGISASADGRYFALACYSGVEIWDSENVERVHAWNAHASHVNAVTFSVDGSTLASCGNDGKLKFWDSKTFAPKLSIGVPRNWSINNLTFVGDGSAICHLDVDRLHLWQIATRDEVKAAGW